MNHKESRQILSEIKKAKKILLNCHSNPDPDSIGSALAMRSALLTLDKSVDIVCPSEKLYDSVSFLEGYEEIKKGVDFSKLDFLKYDLIIILDSSSWDRFTGDINIPKADNFIVVIDHHSSNMHFGNINLVDMNSAATGEILYKLFSDWNIVINKQASISLLTAIIADTGVFKYPNTSKETFKVVAELMNAGADLNEIIAKLYRNYDFNLIKFWGEVLSKVKIDKDYKFIYSVIPYEVFEKYGKPDIGKDTSVDLFAENVKGTDFGFMALEKEPGVVSISFRARKDFDTTKLALELGGGGHKVASGAKIKGLPFDKAVKSVLKVAKKYAEKSQKI